MNKELKSEIANAFRNCKRFLKSPEDLVGGHTPWICISLQKAELKGWVTVEGARAAEKIIKERIEGYVFVSDWLRANVPEARTIPKAQWPEVVQAYRHRWVDALIKEFSK